MVAFEPMFHGWNPVVLLASPFTLFALRRRPLAMLVAASVVCYLLIIRFPLLAIPYAYVTYFEILYTPVRNVIFFIHILAGVSLYLVSARLSQWRYLVALPIALGVAAAAGAAIRELGPYPGGSSGAGRSAFRAGTGGLRRDGLAVVACARAGRSPIDGWNILAAAGR